MDGFDCPSPEWEDDHADCDEMGPEPFWTGELKVVINGFRFVRPWWIGSKGDWAAYKDALPNGEEWATSDFGENVLAVGPDLGLGLPLIGRAIEVEFPLRVFPLDDRATA
jgi:hypothetical protein